MTLQRLLSLVGGVPDGGPWDEFVARVLDAVDGFSPARRQAFFLTVFALLGGTVEPEDALAVLGDRALEDADLGRYALWLALRAAPPDEPEG